MKVFKKKYTPHCADLIRHLSPHVKPFIRALTDDLLKNPYLGKSLRHDLEGYFSVRHNRYRIIYTVDETKKEIVIEYVGSRNSVYEMFSQLKRKLRKKV